MRKKSMEFLLLLILIAVLIAMNYTSLDSFVVKHLGNEKTISVERVIDGDTIVDTDNIHYRMLGINTQIV